MDRVEILDLLTSLTDRSLVVPDQGSLHSRSRLLETVRQYARDLLLESGDAEIIRKRHRDHFLALAIEGESKLKGKEQLLWVALLQREFENIRASLEWSVAGEGSEEGMRLCAAMLVFWWRRGHLAEGREWCGRALATAEGKRRTPARIRVLNAAAMLAWLQGDYQAANELLAESYDILEETGDREVRSQTLYSMFFGAFGMDDYEAARKYVLESCEVARETGERWHLANAGYVYGILTRIAGDYEGAIKSYRESIAIYRDLGDRMGLAYPLYDIGLAEYYQGNFDRAKPFHEESLAIRTDTDDLWGMVESQYGLGLVCFGQKEFESAKSWFLKSIAMGREIGAKSLVALSCHWLGCIALAEDDEAAAMPYLEESLVLNREAADRWGLTHSLAGYAALANYREDSIRSVKLWSQADAVRLAIDSPLPPIERKMRDALLAETRSFMNDDAAYEMAWKQGAEMTLEQAIELAIER
jgi:tetratricopeptide (TPR) repeat protein